MLRKLILLAALALGATEAHAENGLFYLGAGVVHSSVSDLSPLGNPPPIDLKNTTWKAFVGARPLNWLGVEVDYIDLGSGSTSTPSSSPVEPYVASASGSTYAAYAVGFLPIPLPIVDFFGKVGFAGSKFDRTVSASIVWDYLHQRLGIRMGPGGAGTFRHRWRPPNGHRSS